MGQVILNDWTNNPPAARPRVAPRMVRARYDAAMLDDDNRKHWANADALSAKQANSIGVRERLRNHARYEVANNCYARGIIHTLADVVIGYGPTLSFRRPAGASRRQSDALRETARLFTAWAGSVDLWGKLWTMRIAKAQDGEAFALMRFNPRLRSMVQLDLQLIEAEQVTDGYDARDLFDPNKVDGVEADDLGNPIAYKVLREHPGDDVQTSMDPITVPESQIIHWFIRERPGQLRGIPEITAALPLFAQLRRFTLATLTAAETAADFAAVIKSTAAPQFEDDEALPYPFEQFEIERGMYTTLPEGMDIGQLKAEHPTTTYEMFKREILLEIGRALKFTRLMTLGDASAYNYSSGRLDKQATDRALEVERYQCELHVLAKIFEAWLSEALLMPGYLPAEVEAGLPLDPRWLWRDLGHVDRKKEADGAAQDLLNNTTTLAAECARNGDDWEEVLEQRAEELRRVSELGLAATPEQTAAEPQGVTDDGSDNEGPDDEA